MEELVDNVVVSPFSSYSAREGRTIYDNSNKKENLPRPFGDLIFNFNINDFGASVGVNIASGTHLSLKLQF